MIQYTIAVEGMACSMCEAHINDAGAEAFPVKKVTSSRSKKETTVLTETELDEDALRAAISATGYEVGEIRKELGRRRGCLAGKELGHSVEERRLNFAGGISG